MDPAAARKVTLEEKPNLAPTDEVVKEARAMLWGSWEGNWLDNNHAHDARLPGSSGAPVPFLRNSQAQNTQGTLDALDADNFRYRITSREVGA